MRRLIPAVILVLALAGCEERSLIVEMDGGLRWDGYYSVNDGPHNQIDGPGDLVTEESIEGRGKVCWVIVNRGATGSLEVYLKESSILGSDRRGEVNSNAPFGTVTGCDD